MPDLPKVSLAAAPGASAVLARITRGNLVRHFEVGAERLADRLSAVLISEFGMLQDDARAWAGQQVASAQAGADVESMRAEKAADYDRLASEHGAAQKRIADLEALWRISDQTSGAQAAGAAAMADPAVAPLVQAGVSGWLARQGRYGRLDPAADVLATIGTLVHRIAALEEQASELQAHVEALTKPTDPAP